MTDPAVLEDQVAGLTHLVRQLCDQRDAAFAENARLEAERDATESSRRDWAAEAMRLQEIIDEDNRPAIWDVPHPWKDNGAGDPYYSQLGSCRTCGREEDDELHDEPFGAPMPQPELGAPCACVTDDQAEQLIAAGFSRPVCAAHPERREP